MTIKVVDRDALRAGEPTGLTAEKIRTAIRILSEADIAPPLCSKIVSVLGCESFYNCRLTDGHEGRCEPDYETAS